MLSATCSTLLYSGRDNIVSLRFPLQTGLNGHHRLLYPVETQNASSSKHEEKKRKGKKKAEEERLFENLIWIWTLDLMLDKPSCSGREIGSGIVPDQILPCNTIVHYTTEIQIEFKDDAERKTQKWQLSFVWFKKLWRSVPLIIFFLLNSTWCVIGRLTPIIISWTKDTWNST